MSTSTVALTDPLPGQSMKFIGDSTVERSGIWTSTPLVAAHPGLGKSVITDPELAASARPEAATDSTASSMMIARTVVSRPILPSSSRIVNAVSPLARARRHKGFPYLPGVLAGPDDPELRMKCKPAGAFGLLL